MKRPRKHYKDLDTCEVCNNPLPIDYILEGITICPECELNEDESIILEPYEDDPEDSND